MVAFAHELILLCSSEAGCRQATVSSQGMDKQKALCLCDEDWQAQPPLSDREILSTSSNGNGSKMFTL